MPRSSWAWPRSSWQPGTPCGAGRSPRPADTDWLLALPIRRGPLVLPWFALSLGAALLAALMAGFLGALLLTAAGLGELGPLAAACCVPAGCLAVIATVGAAVVVRSGRAARRVRRATPLVLILLTALAAQGGLAATGRRLPWLESAELWLGPWGWAAQPALAAAGGPAPYWPLALALLAVATLAAALSAVRVVTTIPAAELRARSRASGGVATGLMMMNARAARLTAAGAARSGEPGITARWCARLRPPRTPALLIPWRDALALLAEPKRPGLALLLTVTTGGIAALGTAVRGGATYGLTALGAALGCMAAAQLLEPARLDADDRHRASWSPRPPERNALAHAITPTLVLLFLGTLISLPAVAGHGPRVLLYGAATAPVLVASGLLSAYRAPVPLWVLASGAEVAPLVVAVWYGAGPVLAVLGVTGMLGGGPGWGSLAGCWVLAALMLGLLWLRVRRSARR
ncbi:hypothetical protein [Streptomyces sp. MST-110588]|uniref:hypothetical protein n=1 Tax=Streptomyces sp. MST-110588 TaxID=2833628 RepID=UPI001F5CA07F|nr:hypothetical protein [Streptomyces sp. MST-110588]UNO43163.1 hypothetical protein KGS77_31305 [Streptomyces sp. MST-110588]